MSLLFPIDLHSPGARAARSRPGRRPVESDPEERRLHVEVAYRHVVGRTPPDAVAEEFGVSRRTVYNCLGRVLRYPEDLLHADDPELASKATMIRRMLRARA